MAINIRRIINTDRSFEGLARNHRFWVILAIVVAISLIYYRSSLADRSWFWYLSLIELRYNIVGSLYLIPICYAAFTFWWRGALVTWLISLLIILPYMIEFSFAHQDLVSNIGFSFIPVAIMIAVNTELTIRRKERQIMIQREEDRQSYLEEVLKAHENERRLIACELHDDAVQELLVIAKKVEGLLESTPDLKDNMGINAGSEWIKNSILRVARNLRDLGTNLRPDILDTMGLIPALKWLASRMNNEHKINTSIVTNSKQMRIKPQVEVMVFRIVQESLNNIKLHAQASKAIVKVSFTPNYLKITIKDDGVGFDLTEARQRRWVREGRCGILGMQQRTQLLKGNFNITSQRNGGTTTTIELPDYRLEAHPSRKRPTLH